MKHLPVSVVIPVHNEGSLILDTVGSLRAADERPAEIIVVDDGSSDGCCERFEKDAGPDLRVFQQQRQGVAGARNAGLARAQQPVVVFLDAHCAVASDWLGPLLQVLKEQSDAIVGPSVRDLREPRYVGCGAVLVDERLRYRWRPVTSTAPMEVGLLPGGCMAMRRELFQRLGPFDALRHYGLEDVELCLRAWRLGLPVVGVPASRVDHLFRHCLPYSVDRGAAAYNLVRLALTHLKGTRQARALMAAAGLPHAAFEMAAVLAGDWEERRDALDGMSVRDLWTFFDRWGSPIELDATRS